MAAPPPGATVCPNPHCPWWAIGWAPPPAEALATHRKRCGFRPIVTAADHAQHLDRRHGSLVRDRSADAVREQHRLAHEPGAGANHTHDEDGRTVPL